MYETTMRCYVQNLLYFTISITTILFQVIIIFYIHYFNLPFSFTAFTLSSILKTEAILKTEKDQSVLLNSISYFITVLLASLKMALQLIQSLYIALQISTWADPLNFGNLPRYHSFLHSAPVKRTLYCSKHTLISGLEMSFPIYPHGSLTYFHKIFAPMSNSQ